MTERYELINREEGSYPISSMCRWSRVSKSGYYSWRDRPQSQAAVRREELAILIKAFLRTPIAPTGTGASRWSWSGAVCGPTGPRSAPSCVTWACRRRATGESPNHGAGPGPGRAPGPAQAGLHL